jgi:hypothetical protein
MPENTMRVGELVFTLDGSRYTYEVQGDQGLKLSLYPGWKDKKAVAIVQYPKGCNSVEHAGELPSVIEEVLDSMKQDIEQEIRRAKKKLEAFNTQSTEILAAIRSPKETG